MAATTDHFKVWLKNALIKEELSDFSIELEQGNEVGGQIGDVFFVNLEAQTRDGRTKTYNLVAKCGKNSQALREQHPVKPAYENETYVYETLFPLFMEFQRKRGLSEVFDNFPKCFGSYNCESMELVVLQNLSKVGFELWDKRKPMNIEHVGIIMRQYGRLHAISAAMKDQQPDYFDRIKDRLVDVWTPILRSGLLDVFKGQVSESAKMLEGYIDTKALEAWKLTESKAWEMLEQPDCFRVIVHGDCWNNNYMFQYENSDKTSPDKVAFLDWQMCRVGSPILDLSYFLFSCVAGEDIGNMNVILKNYHDSFLQHGKLLGSELSKMYSFDDLLTDWKRFARIGILIAPVVFKVCFTDQEDKIDIGNAADGGISLTDVFVHSDLKYEVQYRDRLKYIVEHAFEQGLL